MGEQVEELRKRYNILPLEAFRQAELQSVGSEGLTTGTSGHVQNHDIN